MTTSAALAIAGVALCLAGYVPYVRDTLEGRTQPHALSWLGWGLLTAIALAGQVVGHAGVGALVTASTAVCALAVFALALRSGALSFPVVDWLMFAGAIGAVAVWHVTGNPLGGVILVTASDLLAFAPTVRKTFSQPHGETTSAYVLGAAKNTLGICALQRLSAITLLFPLASVASHLAFVAMVVVRRSRVPGAALPANAS